jgi:hypothetical protein
MNLNQASCDLNFPIKQSNIAPIVHLFSIKNSKNKHSIPLAGIDIMQAHIRGHG